MSPRPENPMLSLMEVILALKGIPLFASVHGQELRRLSEGIHEMEVKKGELLFAQNDLGEEMYLVHSGRIGIYQEISKNNVERIHEIEPGGFFGEMAIVDELPRSATARAETDSKLLVLNKSDFRLAVQDHPDIAFEVFSEFSRRLRRADEQIRTLSGEREPRPLETP